ncbi:MAG TPA: [FeFe] hydrogenase H-cluster radical SAM maturase HydE [Marinilabiliales bacterium]|nr:MAG: [FeFe] hydrogenase H-cluster radical SAM maturase HydE [Bacteroidetes bacterium GWC2_40_13]OFX73134.1 MAG: [FeFe] hydrogenase H-cluster radical SAM maturase HydE [Bacteroidetes bacterium GWD2_40_43]OFX95249.1 MAG: [FeFe] hydrogenase H-cluster radical SAM maturase HydE [Bacteroidetes bacterium GWE2_40_63]OFY19262.1 MAG: [FeFe] hydrogenase H-cluster radical SAM maturase HydE [Bacteroidetes bacterium GWF2_40_13]OFZ30813.1 MAG: [FeFe] hydrogenase H-cluster radical SAM maturase HydE [Bactero
MKNIKDILNQKEFSKEDLVTMLSAKGDDQKLLFAKAKEVKEREVGKKVYYRGLVEFSNICSKDCYYCGIRKGNNQVSRFNLSDDQILQAAEFAYKSSYGSFVMQSGEISSPAFTERIENLLREIKRLTNDELGITISLGEQTEETYRRWFDAGAHRYLLRIESSNRGLYQKLHPNDANHSFEKRLECLNTLKKIGYQTGTGVMIALPFQTLEHLADDILFMRDFDVDMVGMGPYIEHPDTPLYQYRNELIPLKERFELALRMIATLRIVMRDINIAAATALQAIDPIGREKAAKVGANIIMPNITPGLYRNSYKLYENKPCVDEEPQDCVQCLDVRIRLADAYIGYGEWGDSKHYFTRNTNS